MTTINGDLTVRAVVDTTQLQWTPSPSGTVWRKRLHLVGPAEAGQVTSVVRYEPNSTFPAHAHPDGEEILVLEGVFSDEHGDWPGGSYLLNPDGVRHAPFSRDGCVLFVKLRQYPGRDRKQVALATDRIDWQPGAVAGIETKQLYRQDGFDDSMCLQRWAAGAKLGRIEYAGGAEFFILEGAFEDEIGRYEAGTWLRWPLGASHRPLTRSGCTLYAKFGGLRYLRQGPEP